MKRLGIVAVGLALVVALAACTRTVEKVVVVTPTIPAGTPTLTVEESAYLEAVATAQEEATGQARVHSMETAVAMPTRTPVPPPYKLALISSSCAHSYGFNECKAFVKNITPESLQDVMVVITWVDQNGTPQSADQALIDYNPILSGQESPWSTIGTYNPALTRYRVQFKELLGGTILTRDDRQQKPE